MTTPLPCPRCGGAVEAVSGHIGFVVCCDNCYGWTPDEGHDSEIGIGMTTWDAIADWNDEVEFYLSGEADEDDREELDPMDIIRSDGTLVYSSGDGWLWKPDTPCDTAEALQVALDAGKGSWKQS